MLMILKWLILVGDFMDEFCIAITWGKSMERA